jgi:hypothetical protein
MDNLVTFFKIVAESWDTLDPSRYGGTILATKRRHDHELRTQIGRPVAAARCCDFPDESPWIRRVQNAKKGDSSNRVAAIEITPNNSNQISIVTCGK